MGLSYFYTGYGLSLLNFTAMYWMLRCMALLSTDKPKFHISQCERKRKIHSWIHPLTQLWPKIEWVFPWPTLPPSREFQRNQFGRLCTILLADAQTNRQTNKQADKHK